MAQETDGDRRETDGGGCGETDGLDLKETNSHESQSAHGWSLRGAQQDSAEPGTSIRRRHISSSATPVDALMYFMPTNCRSHGRHDVLKLPPMTMRSHALLLHITRRETGRDL